MWSHRRDIPEPRALVPPPPGGSTSTAGTSKSSGTPTPAMGAGPYASTWPKKNLTRRDVGSGWRQPSGATGRARGASGKPPSATTTGSINRASDYSQDGATASVTSKVAALPPPPPPLTPPPPPTAMGYLERLQSGFLPEIA